MRDYFNNLYTGSCESFYRQLKDSMVNENKMFVVTANPETFMIAQKNFSFDEVLKKDSTIIVPDGIGILKAAKLLSVPVKEKITGVDIASFLLETANQDKKSVYLYGAKENVVQTLFDRIRLKFPDITVAGFQNGYEKNEDIVFEDILDKKPDVILVALGIPKQELLIDKYYERFGKGIFVGVGGSFDVLSGCKKRAPKIFIKLNMEWLYRILSEPKRIKRFIKSNVVFILKVMKLKRESRKK